ncbi:hypothetical protein PJE062_3814 [Pseudovibrio sp. JE062]|nr:hypothetical protein PJE062_3814 [Pseudovibrio sp. JE062]
MPALSGSCNFRAKGLESDPTCAQLRIPNGGKQFSKKNAQ